MSATKRPFTSSSTFSESRNRLLARVAFEAVWEWVGADEMNWDGNVESIFGYSLDEVVSTVSWWRERVHPDDGERVQQTAFEAMQGTADGWSSEYRFRRKDGTWAWVASRCVIERDAAGQARRLVGAMIDISRLKESESRLRLFAEQIPARACATDRELRVVWDTGSAFPGSPSAKGQTVEELFAKSPDRQRVLEACGRALAGESTSLEVDDGISSAHLQLRPFRDPAGNVIGVVGVAFDITARVRSEEEVRAGQRLLREVLEILPVGVVVVDRAGDVVLHNAVSEQVWGRTVVQGAERWTRSKGFWHDSGREIGAHEWASIRALKNGQTSRDELIDIVDFNGQPKTIENYAAPLRDAEGAITGAVIVNEDVTERVRAEERLRKTEKLLCDAEKLGQTGSWEQDLVTGELFNMEPSRHLFFGDDPSKGLQYEDYLAAVHPDDRDRVIASRRDLLAGTGSSDIEFRVVWPDGSVHWIFGRATVVRDAAGRPLRSYGTNRDVTERKNAQEELARRARQLEELSARLLQSQDEERRRIALELHDTTAQNLAAVRLNLARIMRSAECNPPLREALRESLTLTEQSIDEIRTLSYLLHPPMIEEAGLLPALRWYAQGFEERSGVEVTFDFPSQLARLPRDVETAVFRIVQEALTNIQRHSGSSVALIRLEKGDGVLHLTIEDQGRGLPPHLREGQAVLGATGVGLAGIRERARELGGSVQIESRDKGMAVNVTLPVAEE